MEEIINYLKIIRKWWWVVALLSVATVGTIMAMSFLSETQYQATVTVQVSAPAPQEVPLYAQYGRQALRDEIEQTRASFNEFLTEGSVPYLALQAMPDIAMRGSELRSRITVESPPNSQLMRVQVHATDPETAARLANTLVETGLKQYSLLLARPTANTRQFIEDELEDAQTELRAAETNLIQFKIDNKTGNLNKTIESQDQLIQSLRMQSDVKRAEGDAAQAQAIDALIVKREAELQDLLGLSGEYTELTDRVAQAHTTFNFLLDRQAEAQIKENQILEANYIQIITLARPPSRPVPTFSPKLIVLGAVASVLGGVLLTFLLEYLAISNTFQGLQRRPEQPEITTLPDKAR
jgi:uncharacterized protein involved in exopolysaccharide biosynthesis